MPTLNAGPRPRQSWPLDHPVLTTVGTVTVLVILIAALFGGNGSSSGSSSTTTQTVTHTVTHAVRRANRRLRTVVRHAPARTVTVTATARSTVTRTVSAAAGAPAPTASVEGPGSSSHAGDAQFCSTHACIPSFPNGNGYVVRCADGEWSHSGVCLAPARIMAARHDLPGLRARRPEASPCTRTYSRRSVGAQVTSRPVRDLRPGVWHWQSPHPEWDEEQWWPQLVSSYGIELGDEFVLFDPLCVPDDLRARATGVVLTAPYHERDARLLRLPVHAPPADPGATGLRSSAPTPTVCAAWRARTSPGCVRGKA